MKDEFLQREKQYMVETMMKKKNVSQQQIDEYYYKIMNKGGNKTEEISIIRSKADKKYRDIINKLLASDHTEEYVMTILLIHNYKLNRFIKLSIIEIRCRFKKKCRIGRLKLNTYRASKTVNVKH